MKQLRILSIVILVSCSSGEQKNALLELEYSRKIMEKELNTSFDCFKQLLIDSDSSNNSKQPKGQVQQFYKDFSELKFTRDSIVNINERPSKSEWIETLNQFSIKVTKLNGSERTKEKIAEDLKFLRENLDNYSESESSVLFKYIVERWVREIYASFMDNISIDFIEGYQPPCNL